MRSLLIDIGNSNIKTAVGEGFQLRSFRRFEYDKQNFARSLKNILFVLKRDKIYSGVPEGNFAAGISLLDKRLQPELERIFKKEKIIFISRKSKIPFKIKYSDTLGNDRIANAAGVVSEYKKKDTLIIDFGTATTYTLIRNGILIGGMISPGIKTSLDSLNESTSLPSVDINFPKKYFSNNTSDNIKSGVLFTQLFTLEQIVLDIKHEMKNLFIISTGGFGKLMSKKTKTIDVNDEKLSLKGINYILEMNL